MKHEIIFQILEFFSVASFGKCSITQLFHDFSQLGILFHVIHGIVAGHFEGFHFGNRHAENENVLIAHFFSHLHVGTVQGTNGQATVQLETKIEKIHQNDHDKKIRKIRESLFTF